MKTLVVLALVLIAGISNVRAQGSGLTKEETVKYITKKLKEVEGYKTGWSDGTVAYLLTNEFKSLGDGKYEYQYYFSNGKTFCSNSSDGNSGTTFFNEFKAVYIKSIVEDGTSKYNSSIGRILITLQDKALKWSAKDYKHTENKKYKKVFLYTDFFGTPQYSEEYSHSVYGCNTTTRDAKYQATVTINYLKIDPADGQKLVKAFKYLADLEKAEDDPFGG